MQEEKTYKLGIKALTNSLNTYLRRVCAYRLNKLIITRKNKPVAVIIPYDEYKHISEAAEYLESLEISAMLSKRVFNRTKPVKMISHEEMMKKFEHRLKK